MAIFSSCLIWPPSDFSVSPVVASHARDWLSTCASPALVVHASAHEPEHRGRQQGFSPSADPFYAVSLQHFLTERNCHHISIFTIFWSWIKAKKNHIRPHSGQMRFKMSWNIRLEHGNRITMNFIRSLKFL